VDTPLGQDDGHAGAGRRCRLITAWNANALFICLKMASAIAAGCTVVIKPSELSSLQTRVWSRLCTKPTSRKVS